MKNLLTIFMFLFTTSLSSLLFAQDYLNRPEFEQLVKNLEKEPNLNRERLTQLFSSVTQQPRILEAIARPAEKTKTWAEYRPIFINQQRIDGGITFWKAHQETLHKASEKYHVPPEIIVAIIGVETRYGTQKGGYRVIDALATLGFDYPPRSAFFYKELEQFLLLESYAGIDIEKTVGSYAGAMGYGQFIPSSYRHYAVDFNDDGKIDLLNDPVDAIGSVANYFHKHGWKKGEAVAGRGRIHNELYNKEALAALLNPVPLKPEHLVKDFEKYGLESIDGFPAKEIASAITLAGIGGEEYWITLHNFYVITRYNHSRLYAMSVFQLSQLIKMKMDYEIAN